MRLMPDNDALFYGDNLDILRRHVEDESVDLVYLDPPFNSNANYNVLFKSPDGKQRMRPASSGIVIASGAKQSIDAWFLDCFVAFAPRNDGGSGRLPMTG